MLFIFVRVQLAIWNAMQREEGQSMVEYALMFCFITLLAIASIKYVIGKVTGVVSKVGNSV
jgi:Flp pilus assembly pilin Flp